MKTIDIFIVDNELDGLDVPLGCSVMMYDKTKMKEYQKGLWGLPENKDTIHLLFDGEKVKRIKQDKGIHPKTKIKVHYEINVPKKWTEIVK